MATVIFLINEKNILILIYGVNFDLLITNFKEL